MGTVVHSLGAEFESLPKISSKQGRLVFYRAAGPASGATSVFIDGGYQASLQHGAYSQVCLTPAQTKVGVRLVENGRDVRRDYDASERIAVFGGKSTYFRIVDLDNGLAGLKQVSEEVALSELKGSRLQIHTVSRVKNATSCEFDNEQAKPVLVASEKPAQAVVAAAPVAAPAPAPAPAPVAAPVAAKPAPVAVEKPASVPVASVTAKPALTLLEKEIHLSADSMFGFGKSDLQSMLPEGRAALKVVAERLAATYKSQERVAVQIVGHSDPFARSGEAVNTRVSLERAQAVGEYFVSLGFKPGQIITYGKGAAEPVVTTCGTSRTQANFDCNKPNRRVVVTVGTRTL